MSRITIYCHPKVLRENQFNCAFFASFIDSKVYVHQFDIKGDKNKNYIFTKEEFDTHWETLSYHKNSALIDTIKMGVNLTRNEKPLHVTKSRVHKNKLQ